MQVLCPNSTYMYIMYIQVLLWFKRQNIWMYAWYCILFSVSLIMEEW